MGQAKRRRSHEARAAQAEARIRAEGAAGAARNMVGMTDAEVYEWAEVHEARSAQLQAEGKLMAITRKENSIQGRIAMIGDYDEQSDTYAVTVLATSELVYGSGLKEGDCVTVSKVVDP